MAAISLGDSNFEETIEEHDLVLVDFYGENCAPCRQMAPIVDELAGEYAGRAVVAKLNVHENPIASHDAGIRGVPTFVVFKDGKPVGHHLGRATRAQLRTLIDGAVAG
jgi:thioredoxin 1